MEFEEVPGQLSEGKLDSILQEIAGYEVKLEEDPTLPTLGYKYLQRSIAQCRQYLNRVQYYLQSVRRYEKNLKARVRELELDLELKLADKLADDDLVRQQPAAQDRKALAISQLRAEHENLATLRVRLLDVEETVKLIKLKYDDLHRTNLDIKLQRQIVKDDRTGWEGPDGEGYSAPQANQDGTIPGGMVPPVTSADVNPEDLLEGREPEGLPEPRDAGYARQMQDFISGRTSGSPSDAEPDYGSDAGPEPSGAPVAGVMSYDDLLE
jgi:hypothetical protein